MTIPVTRVVPLLLSFAAVATATLVAGLHAPTAGLLLLLGAVTGVYGEVRVTRTEPLERALEIAQGDLLVRSGLRDLLVLGAVAVAGGALSGHTVPVAVATACLVAGRCLLAFLVAHVRTHRVYAVTWRNLHVPGVVRRSPFAPRLTPHLALDATLGGFALMVGVALALLGLGTRVVSVGIGLAVATLAGALFVALVDGWRTSRDTAPAQVVERVAEALRARAPQVVFYYSRPEPVGYIANVWVPTLERLPQSTFVLARQAFNADLVETDTLPVVAVEPAADVEAILPDSVGLALYPSNVAQNYHLIRLPGVLDVFVGHGDSDKGGSATTLTRIYDEAWVSGPAARDRYHVAEVGVRDDQIREVGRPQLAEIRRTSGHDDTGPGDWDYTVLYAPTREGYFAGWQYSSVLDQGDHILSTLMGMPGVRVLFKPHPGTGTDDPAYLVEVERLTTMVTDAGAPHEVVSGEELYHAFNRADLLVSDISSVITDFLASGKPYVVASSSGMDEAAFRAEFPSAGGAYILEAGATDQLAGFVADARGRDSLREERARTAAYLLGDTTTDPLERFRKAVADAIAIQRKVDVRVP
jgi:CDP-Glycerol:Poly(glycerophosphate) glycerophosphotransferase